MNNYNSTTWFITNKTSCLNRVKFILLEKLLEKPNHYKNIIFSNMMIKNNNNNVVFNFDPPIPVEKIFMLFKFPLNTNTIFTINWKS